MIDFDIYWDINIRLNHYNIPVNHYKSLLLMIKLPEGTYIGHQVFDSDPLGAPTARLCHSRGLPCPVKCCKDIQGG